MDRLRKYIINNLYMIFLSMFMPLFAIASVIFMIKLATYTAVIQLTLWDMVKLYLFVLPEILFYTLPLTFFIAATLSLFRLSTDNEMVVLFALGIHPKFIIKTLFKPAALLSALLMFNFLVLFPHATTLSSNFVSYKKSEAKFNLSASEFGHSFGDWLLYIGKDNENETYSDVILFNKNKKEEIIISAKRAEIINDAGILRLKLIEGEGYSYSKEEFSQIDFDTMYINDTMRTDLAVYRTPLEYWLSNDRKESKTHMMITDTLLSLFPLISLFLVVSIGVVHVRHQKGRIYLYLFLGVLLYYGATLGLQKSLVYYTIPTVVITWLIVTYIIYKKNIVERF
ncbi:putative permease, YjgP/YjgQ family [Sulfurimonas gotlandica GD1]|uniref:Putative permease, YjgP/YjgQ family n=1 Tax=Sulfurimonas gotlandica (strain DSM 19862 / JCM 16533 / GD1) TaxID=929558 RepID=B6BJX1_SULGG|nr:LptF/LptG family permease [Sulfurimonas gotlandica]EDZ62602.1 permease YjgP/YjgQ [Sulfurimonas gotlandica GD1]EHP31372.1 putative permease, YjgP/YjgQ family [Sulfurimonas gotlandica GD1]